MKKYTAITMIGSAILLVLISIFFMSSGEKTVTAKEAAEPVLDLQMQATAEPEEEVSDIEGGKETIIQAPLGVKPAEPVVDADDWETEWSRRFGIQLMEVFDSSGDPAWDPAEHPLVYVSSEGPGYSGLVSSGVTLPGFLMLDANSHETVAAIHFDLGQEEYFEPHGLGVSPNGEWIYIPTGAATAWGSPMGGGRLLIVDAKTFKLERILATQGNPHHIKSFTDAQGRELVMVENFNDSTFYVLDPQDNNRVVGGIDAAGLRGSGYLAFAHPSGQYIFVSVRTPFNSEGGVAVVDTETWTVKASIGTHDSSPIYVAFNAQGTLAYVSGGHESTIAKIDLSHENPRAWEVVGMTSAGTLGPYGVTLNWDDSKVYAIGKGEGAHNRGNTMGMADPRIMQMPPRPWAPGSRASFYTDCVRGDHALVHPDPDANEMWISCNASFNTIIWDLENDVIKENLPTPQGGSTHNGAFVQYEPDFSGQVLSDQNGLHGSALEQKLAITGE